MDLKKLIDAIGPPEEGIKRVKEITEIIRGLDEGKIRLVSSIISDIGKIKGSYEELQMVIELFKLICTVDMERLKVVRGITSNVVKTMKMLPKDIPLTELFEELKQEKGR